MTHEERLAKAKAFYAQLNKVKDLEAKVKAVEDKQQSKAESGA